MIAVLHPMSINWFYEKQAKLIVSALERHGFDAGTVGAHDWSNLASFDEDLILIVNFAEIRLTAERIRKKNRLLKDLRRYKQRILINYDSVYSHWFAQQMQEGTDFFTAIFDIGLMPQTVETSLFGIPYFWIPEGLDPEKALHATAWAPGRPLPWTLIGHATKDRARLIASAITTLSAGGFVFCPPLRPNNEGSGLNEAMVNKILQRTDCYIWGSHHRYPYHEALRAPQAIEAGAIPVKIDPLHHALIPVPWVYASLDAFKARLHSAGHAGLYQEARDFMAAFGDPGQAFCAALAQISAAPPPEIRP